MNTILIKVLLAIIIFLSSFISGFLTLFIFKRQGKRMQTVIDYSEAFTCGIFLGIGLIGMLFEANNSFINFGQSKYGFAFLIAGLTFLLFLLIEHLTNNYSIKKNPQLKKGILNQTVKSKEKISATPVILLFSFVSLHSFFAGMGLGVSNNTLLWLIFVGIIAHKWIITTCLTIAFTKTNYSKQRIILWIILFSLTTPLGIVAAAFIPDSVSNVLFATFTSISAGTFIYIGTLHGLYNSILITKCCKMKPYLLTIVGFGVAAGLAAIS